MAFCVWHKDEPFRDHFIEGIYVCSECDNKLFSSATKYQHETPWPAFTEPVHADSVRKVPEPGRENLLKVYCGKCGQGLGHEFINDRDDGKSRF